MEKAPDSYIDQRRPPLLEALQLEGGTVEVEKAIASLTRKGYFAPPPSPWQLGSKDRSLGRGDFPVLDRFGDLVVEAPDRKTAELIVEAVNVYSEPDALDRRGHLTPPPGSWQLGSRNRGFGREDFFVLDQFEVLVVEAPDRKTAELIVEAVNVYREPE